MLTTLSKERKRQQDEMLVLQLALVLGLQINIQRIEVNRSAFPILQHFWVPRNEFNSKLAVGSPTDQPLLRYHSADEAIFRTDDHHVKEL